MSEFLGLEAHAGFILASYAVTIATVAALIAWIIVDGRSQARALSDLEARGLKRRSDRN